jgi:hypothetical protein
MCYSTPYDEPFRFQIVSYSVSIQFQFDPLTGEHNVLVVLRARVDVGILDHLEHHVRHAALLGVNCNHCTINRLMD